MIGQIVNYRYEVLEKAGDGEMFGVYKSRDKVLNRLVALKVLNPELAANDAFAVSVLEGYRSAIHLDHPNIAKVMEADPSSGERFVTCEYARGMNVKDRVRRAGPMAVPLGLEIVIRVLEALEYAHANGVLHGDLRPQDVIVGPEGEVKVTDFGLSYALRAHPEISDKHAMRSVHYQAPEMAEGAEPSVAADIYSIGAMFYEMVTGVVPFEGATAVAVAVKQARELPVSPRSINTGVPKSLSDVILRAIEKSPGDRFPNASVMLADLHAIQESIQTGRPIMARQVVAAPRPVQHPDEAEAEDASLRKSIGWLLALFALVVTLSTLAVTFYLRGNTGGARVPSLLGKTWAEAQPIARDAGLEVRDEGQVFSDTFAAGQICSVVPPPGSLVQSDVPIRVKISKGPSRVPVPDLTGLPEAEAYRVAADKGFTVAKVTGEYSDTVPVNSVVKQSPEGGIPRMPGSSLSLVVSLGPRGGSSDDSSDSPSSPERKFDVQVSVPRDANGSQEVRVVVEDERGESIAYQRYHEPGEEFTETVSGYGSSVRIRVYVGDQLESDATY